MKYESVEFASYMCAIKINIAAKSNSRVIIYLHSLLDGLKNYLLRNKVHRKLKEKINRCFKKSNEFCFFKKIQTYFNLLTLQIL